MPELPEVEGLARFLRVECAGQRIERFRVASIAALRTATPPFTDLHERRVDSVARHGKFLDLEAEGLHLIFHLAKAGWLRWYATVPQTPVKPGGYIAARLKFEAGTGFDLTEAGTRKGLAIYVVDEPRDVPGIARLGPDPLDPGFGADDLTRLLDGSRSRIKNLLRDQSVLAGVGNAYSDEVLHAARLSPFAIAGRLDAGEIGRLHDALVRVLREAVEATDGRPAAQLKDTKRRSLRVHGRAGQACEVCGDTIAEVSFADSALQYCPSCQTGGRTLADRRTSRFLK